MDLKMCPTCKTLVFADMETCFGCMYRFGSDPEREEAVRCEYEASDFPERDGAEDAAVPEDSGEAVDENGISGRGKDAAPDRAMGVVERRGVVPWPPPAEDCAEWSCAACAAARRAEASASQAEAPLPGVRSEGKNGAAVFRLPALTVTVQADGVLPAGMSLGLRLDPPLSETVLSVS